MQTSFCLTGGQVLSADGVLERADLCIADGQIVDTPASKSTHIDCSGYHILPGIVDVHGDAFEQELHPRPGVDIPFPIAMHSVDRQLLSNGITTAYHGLTISWEPGPRSLDAGRRFMAGIEALRPELMANHLVQLRWETFAHDAIDDLADWLAQQPTPAIAFNDHTTPTLEMIAEGKLGKLNNWAQRAGLTLEQYVAEVERAAEKMSSVPESIKQVAKMAARHGAIMLSHDEKTPDERMTNRSLGLAVCEFPMAHEVAADAVFNGEHVVMGAPNVVRGGSHTGSMSAEDAIGDSVCSVLASDYYYPGPLHAAERLVSRGVKPLSQAWNLISKNPAEAMGLRDRGVLEVGRRADVVVVDCAGPWRIMHTIAGGAMMNLAVS